MDKKTYHNTPAPSTLCLACENFCNGKHSVSCNGCISNGYKHFVFAGAAEEQKKEPKHVFDADRPLLFPFARIDGRLFLVVLPSKETMEEAYRLFSPSFFFRTMEPQNQHSWVGEHKVSEGRTMYMVSGVKEDRPIYSYLEPAYQHESVCWRPALIHLDKETMMPSNLLDPGDNLVMGTMKMNGQIITSDLSRFKSYRSGEYLRFGDTCEHEPDNIQWVQIGNVLLSRYNLLGRIGVRDLLYYGLGCTASEAMERLNQKEGEN